MGTPPSPSAYHVPVMATEVVAWLDPVPEGPLVDATLGGAGHLAWLASASAERPLVGVDRDRSALEAARQRLAEGERLPDRFNLLHGSFGELPEVLARGGVDTNHGVSGILLDLGVSSHQLDEADRGFGFRHADAPLDMRMDRDGDLPTAAELLERLDEDELAQVLRDFGEVSGAHRVARAIKLALVEGRLNTTADLARVVEVVQNRGRFTKTHPATTVFQALRIAVNDELGALDRVLEAAAGLLCEGGRLAVMSYHSLEDRRVKQCFRLGSEGPQRPGHLPPPSDWQQVWKVLTRRPVTATDEEIAENPRARSAKLRVAERAPLNPVRRGRR